MLDLVLFPLPKVCQLPQTAPLLKREAAPLWSYAGYPQPVQAIAPFQATLWSTEKKVSGVSCACWLWQWEQGKFPFWHKRSQKHSCHHWHATNCSFQISKSKAERSPSIIQSSLSYITDLSISSGHIQQVKCAKLKHIQHLHFTTILSGGCFPEMQNQISLIICLIWIKLQIPAYFSSSALFFPLHSSKNPTPF